MKVRSLIYQTIRERATAFWLALVLVPLLYYSALLISLVFTFGNFPNYVNFYDWTGNTAEIFRATPSFADAMQIVSEEWLLEIGFMNYDYGFGISEWSLNIMPFKLILVVLLAALLMINIGLYQRAKTAYACPLEGKKKFAAGATTGVGAFLVAMASMTMFWVVCCASPSWVVGLAMLGLVSVSGALALEAYESLVFYCGFGFMFLSMFILVKQIRASEQNAQEQLVKPVSHKAIHT